MGKEAILKSIKKNKPSSIPLPEIDLSYFSEEVNLLDTFKKSVKLVGGSVLELGSENGLDTEIKKLFPNVTSIVSCLDSSELGTVNPDEIKEPHQLQDLDLAIIKGSLGVAENGAIWISEEQFLVRVLPFITNDLVVVLSKEAICLHMHSAYELISERERTFGLFLSGPSKTADIEQCLVIGAQGAMTLTVVLV